MNDQEKLLEIYRLVQAKLNLMRDFMNKDQIGTAAGVAFCVLQRIEEIIEEN